MSNFTTPVEIDVELARLSALYSRANNELANLRRRFEVGRVFADDMMEQEAALDLEIQVIVDQIAPLDDAYTADPWTRYYHVTNVGGHIHTDMFCTSCFPTTQYGWRTDLSGLTEQEVVDREAYNACSVCMPIAPAEQKAARERYNKEQREAKKAERDAKKLSQDIKKQERAAKLVDKVEAAIEKLGGREVFESDYSLYGHDGRKSIYDWSFDNCTQTVGDVLYHLKDDGRYNRCNEYVLAELTKRGL